MKRAVFLDRDGVIVKDKGYVHKIEDLEIIDGAAEAIKNFNKANFLVIVISNQSGIARGLYREEDLETFNREMIKRLNILGAKIDGIYFCPHHPKEAKVERYNRVCECRKPAPGMILKASKEHNVDLKHSWIIGDQESDVTAGKKAGCKTILIGRDAKDLNEATKMINESCSPVLNRKIRDKYNIMELVQELRKNGKKIVFTNGCFDILHYGHIYYLNEAKKLGDALIVGLNSDSSVKKIKGNVRPINGEAVRLAVLIALEAVDYAIVFNEETPLDLIEIIKPNIHVKGGDWKGKKIPEKEAVEKNGGRVEFIDYLNGYSTTSIIEKIRKG